MRRLAFPALALFALILALPLLSLVPVSPPFARTGESRCRVEPLSPAHLQSAIGTLPNAAIVPAPSPRPNPYPRGGVMAERRFAETSEEPPISFAFTRVGGRWLIDDVIPCARATTVDIPPFV